MAEVDQLKNDVNKICERLADKGEESIFVTVDLEKTTVFVMGSDIGLQWLDTQTEFVQKFFKFCSDMYQTEKIRVRINESTKKMDAKKYVASPVIKSKEKQKMNDLEILNNSPEQTNNQSVCGLPSKLYSSFNKDNPRTSSSSDTFDKSIGNVVFDSSLPSTPKQQESTGKSNNLPPKSMTKEGAVTNHLSTTTQQDILTNNLPPKSMTKEGAVTKHLSTTAQQDIFTNNLPHKSMTKEGAVTKHLSTTAQQDIFTNNLPHKSMTKEGAVTKHLSTTTQQDILTNNLPHKSMTKEGAVTKHLSTTAQQDIFTNNLPHKSMTKEGAVTKHLPTTAQPPKALLNQEAVPSSLSGKAVPLQKTKVVYLPHQETVTKNLPLKSVGRQGTVSNQISSETVADEGTVTNKFCPKSISPRQGNESSEAVSVHGTATHNFCPKSISPRQGNESSEAVSVHGTATNNFCPKSISPRQGNESSEAVSVHGTVTNNFCPKSISPRQGNESSEAVSVHGTATNNFCPKSISPRQGNESSEAVSVHGTATNNFCPKSISPRQGNESSEAVSVHGTATNNFCPKSISPRQGNESSEAVSVHGTATNNFCPKSISPRQGTKSNKVSSKPVNHQQTVINNSSHTSVTNNLSRKAVPQQMYGPKDSSGALVSELQNDSMPAKSKEQESKTSGTKTMNSDMVSLSVLHLTSLSSNDTSIDVSMEDPRIENSPSLKRKNLCISEDRASRAKRKRPSDCIPADVVRTTGYESGIQPRLLPAYKKPHIRECFVQLEKLKIGSINSKHVKLHREAVMEDSLIIGINSSEDSVLNDEDNSLIDQFETDIASTDESEGSIYNYEEHGDFSVCQEETENLNNAAKNVINDNHAIFEEEDIISSDDVALCHGDMSKVKSSLSKVKGSLSKNRGDNAKNDKSFLKDCLELIHGRNKNIAILQDNSTSVACHDADGVKSIRSKVRGSIIEKSNMTSSYNKTSYRRKIKCKVCKRAFSTGKLYNHHRKLYTEICPRHKKVFNGQNKSDFCNQSSKRSERCEKPTTLAENLEKEPSEDCVKIGKKSYKKQETCSCPLCGKKYYSVQYLRIHLKAMHNNHKYLCEKCIPLFETELAFNQYMNQHSKTLNLFNCKKCGESFELLVQLHTHNYKVHNGRGERICKYCHEFFKEDNEYTGCLKVHDLNKLNTCTICQECFSSNKSLDCHVISSHQEDFTYICDICGFESDNERKLKHHRLIHDKRVTHTCDICGQSFPLKKRLQDHMVNHHGVLPVVCKTCGKRFKRNTSLSTHMLSHSIGMKCQHCDKHFRSYSGLNYHIIKAHEDVVDINNKFGKSLYTCDQCNAKFNSRNLLNQHLVRHQTERNWVCLKCPKRFKTERQKLKHEENHLENKPFYCEPCDKGFISKFRWEIHCKTKKHENRKNGIKKTYRSLKKTASGFDNASLTSELATTVIELPETTMFVIGNSNDGDFITGNIPTSHSVPKQLIQTIQSIQSEK